MAAVEWRGSVAAVMPTESCSRPRACRVVMALLGSGGGSGRLRCKACRTGTRHEQCASTAMDRQGREASRCRTHRFVAVSYTHLRAHETEADL
eukprot:360665-Amphidinium_carterae.1